MRTKIRSRSSTSGRSMPGTRSLYLKNILSTFFDIAPEDWATLAEAARVISIAIEQALKADGVNIAMNNREHAGQVVDHPHLHIIPRFNGDGLKLMPQRSYAENEAEPVAEKIRVAISAS